MLEDLIMTSSRSPGSAIPSSSKGASNHSPIVVTSTRMGEVVADSNEERRNVTRSLAYKKRLFGQSHLIHATTMVGSLLTGWTHECALTQLPPLSFQTLSP